MSCRTAPTSAPDSLCESSCGFVWLEAVEAASDDGVGVAWSDVGVELFSERSVGAGIDEWNPLINDISF